MTKHFNKISEKPKRINLRKNQTRAEIILWEYLRDKKMRGIKFKRQYSIDNYIVDFYAPKYKLAIEVDGEIHKIQKEYDDQRENYIREAGITFLRFQNEDIEDNAISALKNISETLQTLERKE